MSSRLEDGQPAARGSFTSRMSRVARSPADREATVALGKRIAALRKSKHITQVELSERIGVSQPLISRYEIGKLRAPHDFITKIAEVLEVSADEIFGLAHDDKSNEEDRVTRRFARRLKLVKRLPKRDQDALLRTMDAFLQRAKE